VSKRGNLLLALSISIFPHHRAQSLPLFPLSLDVHAVQEGGVKQEHK